MEYYFHYTSRIAAQMIIASAKIIRNPNGVVYLSDEFFSTGAQAADLLAIPPVGPAVNTPSSLIHLTKPIDVVFIIPKDKLENTLLDGPEEVDQFRDCITGEVIYKGKGRQFKYRGEININGLLWIGLEIP